MPLSSLNTEQYASATAPFGYNLIIASAGTGKTSTIIGRIAYLLSQGIDPKEILLLTFTNKASQEMKQRLTARFKEAEGIEAGTFHSVSYRLLKKLKKNITLKNITDLKILFKSIYAKRNFTFLDTEEKPYQANYLFDLYSLFLNSYQKEFSEWLTIKRPEQEPFCSIYEGIFDEYEEMKEKYNIADYNSLLMMMIKELEKGGGTSYKEVLVDEYQDTNPLQNRLINALSSSSLFCVGDYDQSIYAFNGADISIISSFDQTYEGANVYTLQKNYRSVGEILKVANRVISLNPRIYPKELEVVRGYANRQPKLLAYQDTIQQYSQTAKMITESTTAKQEIAVLFRNNSSADGIELYLREYGIDAKRKGGVGFFDTKEVKIVLDILTFYQNSKDVMSFIHICEYAKGVGSAIANEMFEALMTLGEGTPLKGLLNPDTTKKIFTKNKKSYQLGLFDDFSVLGSVGKFKELHFEEGFLKNPILKHPKLTVEGGAFLYAFYRLSKEVKKLHSPLSIFDRVLESEVLSAIIDQLSLNRSKNREGKVDPQKKEEAKEKIKGRLFLLRNLLKNYRSLERFLNAMVLGSSEFSEGKGVNLLSVHASKGLEFKEVYIIDMMEGRFPNLKLSKSAGGVEEERRLFYVALTRAKDQLILSFAKEDRIKKITYQPSLFLKEAGFSF